MHDPQITDYAFDISSFENYFKNKRYDIKQ